MKRIRLTQMLLANTRLKKLLSKRAAWEVGEREDPHRAEGPAKRLPRSPAPFTIIFLFVTLLSFPASAQESTLPNAPYIKAQTLRRWQTQQKPFTLVDVREPEEFEAGHLEGAINVPYAQVETRTGEFEREGTDYIFYCIHSSWRAPYSANILTDLGYKNIYVLQGGISAWNAGGQVITTASADKPAVVAPYPKDLQVLLNHPPDRQHAGNREMSLQELSDYDGKDGRAAYIAVEGVIYDLTQSRLWRAGEHDPSHNSMKAGTDLTDAIKESPHGTKHLKKFPIVGKLKDS